MLKPLKKGKDSVLSFLFLSILSLLVVGCAYYSTPPPPSRVWVLEKTVTPYAQYNSARLVLPIEDQFRGLEITLVRGSEGVLMYVNACSVAFPCDEDCFDPNMTQINIVVMGNNPYVVWAHRLQGGQRLLLPCEASDRIIESLLAGIPVEMTIGRYYTEIIPDRFAELYIALGRPPLAIGTY